MRRREVYAHQRHAADRALLRRARCRGLRCDDRRLRRARPTRAACRWAARSGPCAATAARASPCSRSGIPGTPGVPGTPLQRIQIVKGWVDAGGAAQEKVFDVAGDAEQRRQRRHRHLRADAARASTRSAPSGAIPSSTATQRAFYYARVLENPTCRWSTLALQRAGHRLQRPGRRAGRVRASAATRPSPKTIQERAWSSPIWYRPEGVARVRGAMRFGDQPERRRPRARRSTLGGMPAGLDPATQALTIALRDDDDIYRVTIPAGTLQQIRPGRFVWNDPTGSIGGIRSVRLEQRGPRRVVSACAPCRSRLSAARPRRPLRRGVAAGRAPRRSRTTPLWQFDGAAARDRADGEAHAMRWLRAPLLHFLVGGAVALRWSCAARRAAARRRRRPRSSSRPRRRAAARRLHPRDRPASRRRPTRPRSSSKAIEEELLFREALARGLDRNDRSVRNWLVEQMRVLSDDTHATTADALYARARGARARPDRPRRPAHPGAEDAPPRGAHRRAARRATTSCARSTRRIATEYRAAGARQLLARLPRIAAHGARADAGALLAALRRRRRGTRRGRPPRRLLRRAAAPDLRPVAGAARRSCSARSSPRGRGRAPSRGRGSAPSPRRTACTWSGSRRASPGDAAAVRRGARAGAGALAGRAARARGSPTLLRDARAALPAAGRVGRVARAGRVVTRALRPAGRARDRARARPPALGARARSGRRCRCARRGAGIVRGDLASRRRCRLPGANVRPVLPARCRQVSASPTPSTASTEHVTLRWTVDCGPGGLDGRDVRRRRSRAARRSTRCCASSARTADGSRPC